MTSIIVFQLLFVIFAHHPTFGDLFRGLNIAYNQYVIVNNKEHFLIHLEHVGNIETTFELFTDTYAIASLTFPTEFHFRKSNSLSETCRKLRIVNRCDGLATKSMYYYHHVEAMFTEPGRIEVNLVAFDTQTEKIRFEKKFEIVAALAWNQCFPNIRMDDCDSSKSPRLFPINRLNIVSPIVIRGCGKNSKMTYEWTVRDYYDKETKYSFSHSNRRTLKIPPYAMWFDDESSLESLRYVIKLTVEEFNLDTGLSGEAVKRCYAEILLAPPYAKINNGNSRHVNIHNQIILNASRSRDLSSPDDDELEYSWNCYSDGTPNSFCKRHLSEVSVLKIPANQLFGNQNYTYTVRVTSIRSSLTSRFSQELIPSNEASLLVDYRCIRNCNAQTANFQDPIYLKAICENCQTDSPAFIWSILKERRIKQIGADIDLVVNPWELTKTPGQIEIQLKVVENHGRTGSTIFNIVFEKPPTKGSCMVMPSNGKEYITDFTITCQGFTSKHPPLNYRLYQEEQLIESLMSRKFKIKLTRSQDSEKANLMLKVTDAIGGHVNYYFKIKLEPLAINVYNGISKFIKEDLNEHVYSGDTAAMVAAVNVISKSIKNLERNQNDTDLLEAAIIMLSNQELSTMQSIEVLSWTLNSLLQGQKIEDKVAGATAMVFRKINDAIEHFSQTNETLDITAIGLTHMSKGLVEIAELFFHPVDNFPRAQNDYPPRPEDILAEDYPDYGRLDFQVVYKINRWKNFTDEIRRLYENLGLLAFWLNEPGEHAMNFETKQSIWRMEFIGSDNISPVNEVMKGNEIFIPVSVIIELMGSIEGKVGIQMIICKLNPFWWYPHQYEVNTRVIVINAFSNQMPATNYIANKVQNGFDIFLLIKKNSSNLKPLENNGYVKGYGDMPIYQGWLPNNSRLTYHFKSVNDSIRVRSGIEKFPRYRQVLESSAIITPTSSGHSVKLLNTKNEETLGYLAILPLEENSSREIRYRFQAGIHSCSIWETNAYRWSLQHCSIGSRTNRSHIHCRCHHFSSFSGKFFLVRSTVELPRNIIYAIDRHLLFPIIVISILSFFLVLLLCLWYCDKRAATASKIYYLKADNSNDTYMYLVTLVTGTHRNAGTSANILIRIIGSEHETSSYTLSPGLGDGFFRSMSENTFALMTPTCLGPLQSIILTNDYNGRYPSWYCEAIRIKDTVRNEEFIFIVRKWLSKYYSPSGLLTVQIPLATRSELSNIRLLIVEHIKRYFTETYPFYNLLLPVGVLSRKEKVVIFMSGISLAAMLSILFIEQTTLENAEDERILYRKVILSMETVMFSVLCLFLGILGATFLMVLFRKGRKISAVKYSVAYRKQK